MLLKDTTGNVRPDIVLMDVLEDGEKVVRISGEVHEETGEDGQVTYRYDEVLFTLGAERTETVEDILEDLDGWWTYGSQEAEAAPTLEERVAAIEDYLIGGVI